jgi:putative oxidoreductase
MNLTSLLQSVGLLVIRLGFGGVMLWAHGLPKLLEFGDRVGKFDPIGLGGHVSLSLAIFAELICSALVMLGLVTRLATVPLIVTMLVAVFVAHADDPWNKKELAVMYLTAFSALLISGAGSFSLDRFVPPFWRKKKPSGSA